MSTSVRSRTRIAEHIPDWLSTGHADARPDSGPAAHSTLRSFSKTTDIGAGSMPIGRTGRQNHPSAATRRLQPNLFAAIKSP
jgi:hypothetical protein